MSEQRIGGYIFVYFREARTAVARVFREVGIRSLGSIKGSLTGKSYYDYYSSAYMRGQGDEYSATPRYAVEATEAEWREMNAILEERDMSGVEIYGAVETAIEW